MLASKSYIEISVERTTTTRLKLRAFLTLNQHTTFRDYLVYQRPQINPYYPSHMKLLEYLSISSSNLPSRKHSFEITRSKRLAINRIITHFYFSVKVTVHCCNIIFQLKWLSMVKSESDCPWLMSFKCLSCLSTVLPYQSQYARWLTFSASGLPGISGILRSTLSSAKAREN